MRGETEYETSQDYQNKTGLVSSMYSLLFLVEASLVLSGRAYWKREKNKAGFDKLRHLDPTSMTLDEKKAQNGGDVFTLQQILGHSTLEMVKHYVNLASNHVALQHRRFSPLDRMSL